MWESCEWLEEWHTRGTMWKCSLDYLGSFSETDDVAHLRNWECGVKDSEVIEQAEKRKEWQRTRGMIHWVWRFCTSVSSTFHIKRWDGFYTWTERASRRLKTQHKSVQETIYLNLLWQNLKEYFFEIIFIPYA